MRVDLILNLLNELNKSILHEPATRSINLVINFQEVNIPFITYPKKKLIIEKKTHLTTIRL